MRYSSQSTRPIVMCANGIVTSGNPLASQAALRVLQDGGNAIDAAVTAGAVLAVVQPDMSGVGGDAFMLHWDSAATHLTSMNASGRAPIGMTRETLASHRAGHSGNGAGGHGAGGHEHGRGPLAASVPGAVRGWADAIARHGSIGLADALRPAIRYATDGYPVSRRLAESMTSNADLLRQCAPAAATYLLDGSPFRTGERLVQPDLAATLTAIAEGGPGAFYEGEIGRSIAAAQRAEGGLLTEDDLRRHEGEFADPISVGYRGYEMFVQPPVSLGLVLLEELAIVEGYDLANLALDSAERAHLLIEAKKLAFADLEAHLTDPAVHDVPVAGLLADGYVAERRSLIDPAVASGARGAGDPRAYGRHTAYLAVVDGRGNAVSWIQSIFERFGSGWMAPGTGFLLNDRMNGFSVQPEHVNCVAGGKRTAHTLNAPMVFRDGRPVLVTGSPGGYGQVQTNLQTMTAFVDHGLDVQAMVEAPRWLSGEGRRLAIEDRFPEATLATLQGLGHELDVKGPWSSGMGDAQAIHIDRARGLLEGGADPRRESYAVGW